MCDYKSKLGSDTVPHFMLLAVAIARSRKMSVVQCTCAYTDMNRVKGL